MVGPGPYTGNETPPDESGSRSARKSLQERLAAGVDVNCALDTWQNETFGPTLRSKLNLDGLENKPKPEPVYCFVQGSGM